MNAHLIDFSANNSLISKQNTEKQLPEESGLWFVKKADFGG